MDKRQRTVFVLTYVAYIGVYLTRKPLSVVKSDMSEDLGMAPSQLANIDTAFLTSYAIGQFSLGALEGRLSARTLLILVLSLSALSALVFGSTSTPEILLLSWAVNGAIQSAGFPVCMQIIAQWFAPDRITSVLAMWTTSQQIGGVVATSVATALASYYGWRAAFLYPAAVLLLLSLFVALALPHDPPSTPSTSSPSSPSGRGKGGLGAVVRVPEMWALGMAYFCIKLVRYTLMFWLPYYMTVELGYSPAEAGYLSTVFDITGVAGSLVLGWVTDKFAGGDPVRVTLPLCVLTGFAALAYSFLSLAGPLSNAVGMGLLGLAVAGPDSALGGACVNRACSQAGLGPSLVSTASGFVNGMGSIGAMGQGMITVYVTAHYGWSALFTLLASLSMAAAASLVPCLTTSSAITPAKGR